MLTETHRFRLHGSARCVALSQAEDVLAVGLMNAEIALCDLDRLDDIVAGQKPGSDGEPPTG